MTKLTAKDLAQDINVTISQGVATLGEKSIDAALEKLDIKREDITKAQNALATVANAVTHAVGEASIQYLKDNKEEAQVTLKEKIGHEQLDVVVSREKEVRSPLTGETTTVYGAVSQRRTQKNGGAELKSIKDHIKELGASLTK